MEDLPKQLRIKTQTCKRVKREYQSYEVEAKQNDERIQKMRNDNRDPYDIRKQEEVLQESYMMIPESRGRLALCYEDLEAFMAHHSDMTGELVEEAQKVLSER